MPSNSKWQEELKKLRKALEENRQLMRRAAVMAEDMIAVRQQFETMQRELEIVKRSRISY